MAVANLQASGDLAAREFDAVLRVKLFDFPSENPREQVVGTHAQDFGEDKKFQVRNAPLLVFEARHGLAAGVPAAQLQLDGELALRPALLLAKFSHLRADNVQL